MAEARADFDKPTLAAVDLLHNLVAHLMLWALLMQMDRFSHTVLSQAMHQAIVSNTCCCLHLPSIAILTQCKSGVLSMIAYCLTSRVMKACS